MMKVLKILWSIMKGILIFTAWVVVQLLSVLMKIIYFFGAGLFAVWIFLAGSWFFFAAVTHSIDKELLIEVIIATVVMCVVYGLSEILDEFLGELAGQIMAATIKPMDWGDKIMARNFKNAEREMHEAWRKDYMNENGILEGQFSEVLEPENETRNEGDFPIKEYESNAQTEPETNNIDGGKYRL